MEAVYLEDIAAFRPHFKAIHSLGNKRRFVHVNVMTLSCVSAEEVSELCSGILGKEREDLVHTGHVTVT